MQINLNNQNYKTEVPNLLNQLVNSDDNELIVIAATEQDSKANNETNDSLILTINAVIGRMNRMLLADKQAKVTPVSINKIKKLSIIGCTSRQVKELFYLFSRHYYQSITHLSLKFIGDPALDDVTLEQLKACGVKEIFINADAQYENNSKKLARDLLKIDIQTYLNETLQTLPEDEAPVIPKVKIIPTSLLNSFRAFRKIIQFSINCPNSEIEIALESVFFHWGRTFQYKNESSIAAQSLGKLLKLIRNNLKSASGEYIYLYNLKMFFHQIKHDPKIASADLALARDFFNNFLMLINQPDAKNVLKEIAGILKIQRDACLIPCCDTFEEFEKMSARNSSFLTTPEAKSLVEKKALTIKEIQLFSERFEEFFIENLSFSVISKLIEEIHSAFGSSKTQEILYSLLTNKQLNLSYLPQILNIGLQLFYPASTNPEFENFVRLINKKALINSDTWPLIVDQLNELLVLAHQKRFPEKPLAIVFNEFTTRTADVRITLSIEEAIILFKKYETIQKHGDNLTKLTNDQLKIKLEQTLPLKTEKSSLMLLAIIRENIKRHFKIYPYNTQMINLLAVLNESSGKRLGQVLSGEGKSTIIAMLAAYTAFQDRTFDAITTTRDLAIRDSVKYAPFYKALGLTVGHNATDDRTPELYVPQIIYGILTDFQFAYLAANLGDLYMNHRKQTVGLVDEADNMFLDTQGSPAYISARIDKYTPRLYELIWAYFTAQDVKFTPENLKAYLNEHLYIEFSDETIGRWMSGVATAARLKENKHYVIVDNGVVIVDYEHTGQLRVGYRWHNGTHPFLEAAHGVKIKPEDFTTAQITNLEYFNLYKTLYGLTGTLGNRDELKKSYNLTTYDSPPYLASIKVHANDILTDNVDTQDMAILQDVKTQTDLGRPVLILCETIEFSRHYLRLLEGKGSAVQNYNAMQKETAETILHLAGNPGVITIATNTAGRGADIITTPKAEENGGLHVIITFPPINERVELQGFNRTGRNGKKGTYRLTLNKLQLIKFFPDRMPDSNQEIIQTWKERRKIYNEAVSVQRQYLNNFFRLEFISQKIYFKLPKNLKKVFKDQWAESYDKLVKSIAEITASPKYSMSSFNEAAALAAKFVNKFFVDNKLNTYLDMRGANALHYAVSEKMLDLACLLGAHQPQLLNTPNAKGQIPAQLESIPNDIAAALKLLQERHPQVQARINGSTPTPAQLLVRSMPFISNSPKETDDEMELRCEEELEEKNDSSMQP